MGLRATGLEKLLTEEEIELKIVYLVGAWVEALLYGIYFCLFVPAITIFVRRDSLRPFTSKVFFTGNILIFLTISFHNALNLYRVIQGFALPKGGGGLDIRGPVLYLNNLRNWTGFAAPVLLAVVIWIGDALVIYRCFLIWQRRFWIIVVPLVLFCLGFGTHIANFWWINHQSTRVGVVSRRWPLLNVPFNVYLIQNILTTFLITLKIYRQHRRSRRVGTVIQPMNTPSLITIVRIMIESAALYTAGIVVAVVFRALDHPWGFVTHCILFPAIGIIFMLMALRLHAVQEGAKIIPASASLMPSWLSGDSVTTETMPWSTSGNSDLQFLSGPISSSLRATGESAQVVRSEVERMDEGEEELDRGLSRGRSR